MCRLLFNLTSHVCIDYCIKKFSQTFLSQAAEKEEM